MKSLNTSKERMVLLDKIIQKKEQIEHQNAL